MISNVSFQGRLLVLFCLGSLWVCPALAQQALSPTQPHGIVPNQSQPASLPMTPDLAKAPYQLAERSTPVPNPATISMEQRPGEHPLMPALRWANRGLQQMDQDYHDYSAVLVKRERGTDGKLGEEQWMHIKIRHKPFSVYMLFLKPRNLKGQEVIYVEGANNGNMLAHGTGIKAALGTLSLKPTSPIAMRDQHYPITELGLRNLIERLLEVGSNDTRYRECEVKFFEGAKINQRDCTCIQVVHPVPRRSFLFHMARIYVDRELNVPIRYESYDWPKEPGGDPELIEEYTYLNLKINNGFTDSDFDTRSYEGFKGFKARKH
ncbi:MAG: DUF1571 domain-containing protein [Pirellulales bacterium]|nr:DUF1571 domain-containing protein [Pirellulales bacterium]